MSTNLCRWCNGREHSGGCDREALKRIISQLRGEQTAAAKLPDAGVIMISSLVSGRTSEPRVNIQIGAAHSQLPAAAAIKVAQNLMQVAMGGYADAFIYNFLKDQILKSKPSEDNEAIAGNIMVEFRDYRDKLQSEFERFAEEHKPGEPI